MIASAVDYAKVIALVLHGDETKAAFASQRLIDALAVGAAFDRAILIERRRPEHRQRRAAAGRVIGVASVIGRQHVGIAMKNTDALDLDLFDEVSDFEAIVGESGP